MVASAVGCSVIIYAFRSSDIRSVFLRVNLLSFAANVWDSTKIKDEDLNNTSNELVRFCSSRLKCQGHVEVKWLVFFVTYAYSICDVFPVNLRLQFPFNNNNNSRRRFNRATNWFESFPLSAPYGPSIGWYKFLFFYFIVSFYFIISCFLVLVLFRTLLCMLKSVVE